MADWQLQRGDFPDWLDCWMIGAGVIMWFVALGAALRTVWVKLKEG